MITTKVKKAAGTDTQADDKLIKLLESIDWKLWEIMNMLKDNLPEKDSKKPKKTV